MHFVQCDVRCHKRNREFSSTLPSLSFCRRCRMDEIYPNVYVLTTLAVLLLASLARLVLWSLETKVGFTLLLKLLET